MESAVLDNEVLYIEHDLFIAFHMRGKECPKGVVLLWKRMPSMLSVADLAPFVV